MCRLANSAAFAELLSRHPDHSLPDRHMEMPAPSVIKSKQILERLKAFPRGSSPGASQLCAQHLLDAHVNHVWIALHFSLIIL